MNFDQLSQNFSSYPSISTIQALNILYSGRKIRLVEVKENTQFEQNVQNRQNVFYYTFEQVKKMRSEGSLQDHKSHWEIRQFEFDEVEATILEFQDWDNGAPYADNETGILMKAAILENDELQTIEITSIGSELFLNLKP